MRAILILIACCLPLEAAAFFIEDDPQTRHCCGEADCRPAGGKTFYTSHGWGVVGVTGFVRRGDRRLFENRDTKGNEPWVCVYPNNTIRCLILPRTRI